MLAFSSRFVAASLLDGLIPRCPPFLSLLRFYPRDKRELDPVGSVLGRRVASFGGDGVGLEVNVSVRWLVVISVVGWFHYEAANKDSSLQLLRDEICLQDEHLTRFHLHVPKYHSAGQDKTSLFPDNACFKGWRMIQEQGISHSRPKPFIDRDTAERGDLVAVGRDVAHV